MEKRRHPRIRVRNLSVDINDGDDFFQGVISNLSRNGMCMTDLSNQLKEDVGTMMIIIQVRDDYLRMFVKPKWFSRGEAIKTIGAEIVNIPWRWKEFVMKHEPLPERNVTELIYRVHQRQKRRNRS
jgi:hypothetical protein